MRGLRRKLGGFCVDSRARGRRLAAWAFGFAVLFLRQEAVLAADAPLSKVFPHINEVRPARTVVWDGIVDPRGARARALIELSKTKEVDEDPALRLMLVHGLFAALTQPTHPTSADRPFELTPHTRRADLLTALRTLAEPNAQPSARPPLDPGPESSPEPEHLGRRAQASALLALAQSHDRAALAYVLSVAFTFDSPELWIRDAARLTLFHAPDLKQQLLKLQPLLSPQHIAQLLQPQARAPLPSLAQLQKLAKSGDPNYEHHVLRLAELLQHRQPDSHETATVQDYRRSQVWKQALGDDPLWALRTLTLLGDSLDLKILRLGRATALPRSGDTSDLGHAAHWFLDTHFPNQHPHSASKEQHPIEQRLRDPSAWTTLSTQQLWRLYGHKQPNGPVAALCSRYTPRQATNHSSWSPTLHQLRRWLSDETEDTRASCAFGLSQSHVPSLLVLIEERYFSESSVAVRAALTVTLRKHLGATHPLLRSIAQLDQDARCRQAARGTDKDQVSQIVVKLKAQVGPLTTWAGNTVLAQPAADGFVGWVDRSH